MLMGRPVPESDFPFSKPSPAPRKKNFVVSKKRRSSNDASKTATEAEDLTMMENDIMAQYRKVEHMGMHVDSFDLSGYWMQTSAELFSLPGELFLLFLGILEKYTRCDEVKVHLGHLT
jgi:hypothetical protein